MSYYQTLKQHNKTEDEFVAEIKTKSLEELRHFLAGPWTASILSPESIEELYQYQEQRQKEEPLQQEH